MCHLWLSFLVLVAASAAVASESHWESYTYNYYSTQYSCSLSYYYYCYNWWYYPYYYGYYYYGYYWYYGYYNWCFPTSYYNCYYTYYLNSAIGQRCQTGWTGSNCDIAVCSPACSGGQSCVSPNSCSCLASGLGSKCSNVPCSKENNCYPGTCSAGSCKCPSGFTGPNCATITFVPLIQSCAAKIHGRLTGSSVEQVVALSTECTAPDVSRKTIWIPTSSVTQVDVSWLAKYENPVSLPDNNDAAFIANAPVSLGIAKSTFTVGFQGGRNAVAKLCPAAYLADQNMPLTADCSNTIQAWADLGGGSAGTAHNSTFTITLDAWIGARKKSSTSYTGIANWGSGFPPQDFTSYNSTKLQITFGFDLKSPVHCLTNADAISNNCTVFPIYMNETVTENPKIHPTFNAWSDDASGIDRFHVDAFYMQPNADNKLQEIGAAVFQADIPDSELALNKVQFTVSLPGTYAIHLTVYDRANNTAKARKIFTYLGDTSLAVNQSALYIDKTDPATGFKYITKLEAPQNNMPYELTVLWPKVFKSSIDSKWKLIVQPWPIQANMIDDNYGNKFGMRSVDAMALTGVVSYQFAYVIDKNGGIGVNTPTNFTDINDTTVEQFRFKVAQNDLHSGDTIVAWVRAYSWGTVLYTAKTMAYVDTCMYCVNVTESRVQYHTVDQYTTSIFLNVKSHVGGIGNITCDIYDSTKKVSVKSLIALVAKRDPPSSVQRRKRAGLPMPASKPCLAGDATCYCTALGPCYDVTQVINIDNCDIDKFAGDTLTLTYSITSLTGHVISGTVQIQPQAKDSPCRPLDSLPVGAIIGIIIACIIGLIIIILLIIMLVRSRVQHKHPLPSRVRTMASHVKSTFVGQTTAVSVNELYEGQSAYIKSNNAKVAAAKKNDSFANDDIYGPAIENPDWKISDKDVQLEGVVAEGRFAVVRKARLTRGNRQTAVAAKTLKSGYKTSDIGLMRLKIKFLAKEIRPHKNVVKFIGAVDEDVNTPPIMLMELCDLSLKDWLASNQTISVDILENMLTFTLNIAQGMEHLHSIGITHRRLAARNVLLKQTPGGLEAKLIGLDPPLDDDDEAEGATGQSTVPIKWLAPETLATLGSLKPTYDEKTDVWSFGVTVWEIYSQGQNPYPTKKSNDVRSLIQKGHRMSCPPDCPSELFEKAVSPCWNASPKKRPKFQAVVRSIEEFRRGSSGADNVYYAAEDDLRQGPQGNDDEMYVDAR